MLLLFSNMLSLKTYLKKVFTNIPAGSELSKFLICSNLLRNGFQKIGLNDKLSSYQDDLLKIGLYF